MHQIISLIKKIIKLTEEKENYTISVSHNSTIDFRCGHGFQTLSAYYSMSYLNNK